MKAVKKRELMILNWLNIMGIPDEWLQDEIITNYCHDNNYKPLTTSLNSKNDRIFFICQRFEHFKEWADSNYSLLKHATNGR